MFHCNGWCFPWSISLLAGTHVCLRAVRAKPMYDAIADHEVTHLSGAPFVMSALLNATDDERRIFPQRVAFSHAAAPPPAAVLAKMDEVGLRADPSLRADRDLRSGHAERMARGLGRAAARGAARQAHPPGRALSRARGPDRDGPRDHGEGPGRRRDARRGHVPRQYRDEGLSQEPEGDRGGLRRRLVPFRRSRRAAPRRLYPAEGSLQGHHHLGRREHLIDRGRGRALQAPRRRRRRRRRQARREMGRDAVRLRRAAARTPR